ncbi:winged helix-turn-helix domain-containing protein [Streptosporangium sp. NPDC001559]|uniref:winged helix-turn-helix domain-containing protein n=1 Tax=Streptosporangium sp. NPDC001559 TaxID=3366187 RepID=UPI0036E7822B
MVGEPARHEVTDLEALTSLTHPRRRRILDHLYKHGPATSATLARELDLNTGATSYHLRELAKHGFVEEAPAKGHGRERWWRFVMADFRFPRRSRQDTKTRAVLDEMNTRAFAADIQQFQQALADTSGQGGWDDAFPYSRGSIRVSLGQLEAFFEEYVALLMKYSGEEPDGDARTVNTVFMAYPEA